MSKGADARFSQVLTDPRFRTLKRSERKVKVDSRFKGMFTEKRFKTKYVMDKRGKRTNHVSSEDMKAYYDLSDEEAGASAANAEKKVDDAELTKQEPGPSGAPKKPTKRIPDARGQVDTDEEDLSSSSDEDSSGDEGEEFDHKWGELDKDVVRGDDVSRRLAICNIDWDRIKAVDLYLLLNSFKPDGSSILSVKIYPSEFGKQRMADEEQKGPAELIEKALPVEDDDDANQEEDEEGTSYVTEKLRQYQLNRLKYFYAVVECDNEATATALYDEVDGFEYESSASALDVRFVPDDVTFDENDVSSECSALPDAGYAPPVFITSALQQSKVRLTWDETDPRRKEKLQKFYDNKTEKDLDDLGAYLASSGEESEDDDEVEEPENEPATVDSKLKKYKDLLKSLDADEGEDQGLELTWEPSKEADQDEENDKEAEAEIGSESEEEPEVAEEPVVDTKKRKNKKGSKKHVDEDDKPDTELNLLLMDEDDKSHFNYEDYVRDDSKKKKKKATEDNFEVRLIILVTFSNNLLLVQRRRPSILCHVFVTSVSCRSI